MNIQPQSRPLGTKVAIPALLTVLLNGCHDRSTPVARSYQDSGKVCIGIDAKVAPPEANDAKGNSYLVPDAPLILTVYSPQEMPAVACLRPSSHCSVHVEGNVIRVKSQFYYDIDGKAPCAATSTAALVCDGPPLANGEYVLQHGKVRTPFQVPLPLPFCSAPRS